MYDLNQIVGPLIEWYQMNRRDLPWRHNPTPYRVWISEIMLQQTRVDPVIPYYNRFMDELPDVYALANVSEEKLMKLWEGLGYYSRARNLQKAAKQIVIERAFPSDFEGWLKLPGIGEYTAGAICSIALGLPTPAVDGNVLRVISRLKGSFEDITLASTKKTMTSELKTVYPEGYTSEFTQGLMELGALICLPNGSPLCEACPLLPHCEAYKNNLIDRIPVKPEKKKRKSEDKTVLILRYNNKVALHQRPAHGLLARLWEFPNLPELCDVESLKNEFQPLNIKTVGESLHIFSHIEWHMVGYDLVLKSYDDRFEWFSIDDVLHHKAIPTAFKKYTDYLKELRFEEI